MPPAFLELSALLVLATGLGICAKLLKQPLIVAYILAGVIISSLGIFKEVDKSLFELLSNLGIAFLLFLVGIELKFEDLKYVGRAAVLTGLGQIIFTTLIGFILVAALGFGTFASLYIAFAITFSSTVIIIKLLSEKNDLQSLHGKIAVGFLIVQDVVAILALMILSGLGNQQVSAFLILGTLLKGIVLAGVAFLSSKYLLRFLFRLTSSSLELLFVSALAWAFLMAAVAGAMGFSTAIGAFLAGLAIASSPYRIQISARVKPIRDFFIVIFFIVLGSSMPLSSLGVNLWQIIVLSLFVLVGGPLIVFAIMMSLKFRNRTAFLASITVAQISEFSLILMTTGLVLGYVTSNMVALVSAVAIVTIALSSYLILYGEEIYKRLAGSISRIFPEKQHDPYVTNRKDLKDHVILVGAEQMGWDILQFLKMKIKDKSQIVVVDFNPEIIKTLKASGYNAVFGDISDPEVLEELELEHARLIVVTDVNVDDSYHLIKFARSKDYKGPVIGASYWIHDAVKLYELGADYVVVPETLGGKHIAKILGEDWEDLSKIKKAKAKHFEELLAHKIF
ncbi:MAG: cation:proton antiporter [Candidatus Curtissbacteria bacterium]|nr:cation:proton antiporter [Candidatus Curtissbacteria bacterium]